MAKILINKQRCKGCLLCVSFCPRKLIKKGDRLNKLGVNPAEISPDADCIGCAMCAVMCPDCCIEVVK